jgi:hypothetical protein
MNKIYLIPGLGADKRVFKYLKLPAQTFCINWIKPGRKETLQDYCRRLVEVNQIEKGQIFIGLSFGGIVAIELARIIAAKDVIIISSVKNRKELPLLFRLAGKIYLHKLLPYQLLKKPSFLLRLAFGPISDKDYDLLKKIVADTDLRFLKWAINQVILLPADISAENIIHIHGSSDRIFTKHFIKNYISIENGGHFMVVNLADEISSIINQYILQIK